MAPSAVARDLDSIKGARSAVWSRANLREVLPELPSPGSWASLGKMLNEGTRRYYGRLLASEEELGPPFALLAGRPYWNLSQFARVGGFARMSPATLMRVVGQAGEVSIEDARPIKHSIAAFMSVVPTFLRLAVQRLALPVILRQHFATLRRTAARFAATDPGALDDSEIWRRILAFNRLGPRFIGRAQAIVGLLSFEVLRPLEVLCRRLGFSAHRLLDSHLAVGKRTVSGQQAFDLLELARLARNDEKVRSYFRTRTSDFADLRAELEKTEFLGRFDDFVKDYGHRAPYESDLSIPRYREDPSQLLAAVRSHLEGPPGLTPAAIEAGQKDKAAAVWREFIGTMPRLQRPILGPFVRFLLRKAKKAYAWRELSRFELTRVGEHIRNWILVLAERFVSRGWIEDRQDVFFLSPGEMEAAMAHPSEGHDLLRLVADRKHRQRELATVDVPLVIDGRLLEPMPIRRATGLRADLTGLCISSGIAEGEVVVVHEPTEFPRMKSGAILVAPATDPAWTPLFVQAAGVIVEVGGQISHAAIVARELGLPALANVRDATSLLREGDVVRLDATNETVEILHRG